ncbi:MAG TPA: glycosyltransferase family A protein [Actinoplanes sp.]|nr:glycosyltransferase family A protein [Actinoplanes sp.]
MRHGEIEISRLRGGWRAYGLDDGQVRCFVAPDTLTLQLPDAAALVRLSASGVLHGRVRRLRIRLTAAPDWLLAGIRPPRIGRNVAAFSWRRRSGGVEVRFVWSRQRDLDRALQDALSAVLRARPWDQASGPVYALDRTAWTAGASSWPQGLLATAPPQPEPDALGRPLGPFLAPEPPGVAASTAPVVTAVANPFGRILLGTATPYRLVTEGRGLTLRAAGGELAARLDPAHGAEAGLSGAELRKFAVVQVDAVPDGRFAGEAIRAMSACGMVFAAADPAVRTDLRHSGAVTVADAAEVSDLAGYGLSVAASRRAAIAGDAALRRTPLAGGDLPLPAVSVVLSSMRADDVETCLGYLAAQTYPAFEIVLGLHGYDVPAAVRQRWAALVPVPLEVVSVPAAVPFGMVLGQLTRRSSGDLITKVDDDDHYGPHHLTDLVIAAHTSGADLTAKGARFVHFPELETTIDRAWAAPEVFNVTPAGGTMLLSRSTLAQIGGWSHSSKHVDADLLKRIRAAGGLVYRTHALEYVYVRRTAGHTFVAEIETLAAQGERSYPGLPEALIRPAYPAVD